MVEKAPAAKRPRRNSLAAAAVGCLDIREAFARGAASSGTAASTTLEQEAAFVEWAPDALQTAQSAWDACPADASTLVLAANFALIPAAVVSAFGLVQSDLIEDPQLIDVQLMKRIVQQAVAWRAAQDRLWAITSS